MGGKAGQGTGKACTGAPGLLGKIWYIISGMRDHEASQLVHACVHRHRSSCLANVHTYIRLMHAHDFIKGGRGPEGPGA